VCLSDSISDLMSSLSDYNSAFVCILSRFRDGADDDVLGHGALGSGHVQGGRRHVLAGHGHRHRLDHHPRGARGLPPGETIHTVVACVNQSETTESPQDGWE